MESGLDGIAPAVFVSTLLMCTHARDLGLRLEIRWVLTQSKRRKPSGFPHISYVRTFASGGSRLIDVIDAYYAT
eukprot:12856637-Ditylum_brightwellii.AAC.1